MIDRTVTSWPWIALLLWALPSGLLAQDAAEPPPTQDTPAPPAEGTPAERTPAEQAPAEQAPAEQAPAEQTPAEQTPAEQAPAGETPPAEGQTPPAASDGAAAPAEGPAAAGSAGSAGSADGTAVEDGAAARATDAEPPPQPVASDAASATDGAPPQPPQPPAAPRGAAPGVATDQAPPGTAAPTTSPAKRRKAPRKAGGAAAAAVPGGLAGAQGQLGSQSNTPNWNSSRFGWGHSASLGTFDRSLQRSYNPEYTWAFDAVLNFNVDNRLSLGVNQGANIEITDSDSTVKGQQLLLSDLQLRADYMLLMLNLTEEQLLFVRAGVAVTAPVSKASRAATLFVGTAARASVSWFHTKVLAGLIVGAAASVRGNLHDQEVIELEQPFPCAIVGADSSLDCRNGTTANTAAGATVSGSVTLNYIPTLSSTLSYARTWNRRYGFDPIAKEIDTGPIDIPGATAFRVSHRHSLGLSLTYQAHRFILVSAQLANIYSERGPDGELRSPLDAQDIYLGMSVFAIWFAAPPADDDDDDDDDVVAFRWP